MSDGKNLDLSDLEESELTAELTARYSEPYPENTLFGKISQSNLVQLFKEVHLWDRLNQLGYFRLKLEIHSKDYTDNRIKIYDESISTKQHLVFLRLKFKDYQLKYHKEIPPFPMIYIDWLETCHIKAKNTKKLYPGQKYPGLGLYPNFAVFFKKLAFQVGSRGAFNMPEYYHDAFLFHRDFWFYNPAREAEFRAVRKQFHFLKIRQVSDLLHQKKICKLNHRKEEVFPWKPAEMLSFIDKSLHNIVFSRSWEKQIHKHIRELDFAICHQN